MSLLILTIAVDMADLARLIGAENQNLAHPWECRSTQLTVPMQKELGSAITESASTYTNERSSKALGEMMALFTLNRHALLSQLWIRTGLNSTQFGQI
jgi:hypothetical protein